MSVYIADLLNLARSQLGVAEEPRGSNNIRYNTWYYGHSVSGSGYAWCAVFVSWLFWTLGAQDAIWGLRTNKSNDFLAVGRKYNAEVSITQVRPGDICVFDWGDGGVTDHIGIVESKPASRTVATIEGNVGNAVGRRLREPSRRCRMWFVRPQYLDYITPPAPPKKKEEELMLVPFVQVSKQKDLFVLVAAEGWYDVTNWSGECWLLIKNEGGKSAKIDVFTTPFGAKYSATIPPRDDPKSRIAVNMRDIGAPTGGFATTVKSTQPDVVCQLAILATKK